MTYEEERYKLKVLELLRKGRNGSKSEKSQEQLENDIFNILYNYVEGRYFNLYSYKECLGLVVAVLLFCPIFELKGIKGIGSASIRHIQTMRRQPGLASIIQVFL